MRAALSKEDEDFLDENMLAYLGRKSCTSWHSISCHFELHTDAELEASIARLTERGRVDYDARRKGYCTKAMLAPTAEGKDGNG